MTRIIIAGMLIWSVLCASAWADTHLFILSGASNMEAINPNAVFKPTVKAGLPDDNILIVKVAKGSTPIVAWDRYEYLYNDIMTQSAIILRGKKADTITLCWMHGELDANPDVCNRYKRRLKGLIKNLRSDFGFPNMNIVIGRISDHKMRPWWRIVRQAQMDIADGDPRAVWFDTDDLNDPGKRLHYTDYTELAGRFAIAALNLIEPGEYEVVVDESQPATVSQADDGGCFIRTLR